MVPSQTLLCGGACGPTGVPGRALNRCAGNHQRYAVISSPRFRRATRMMCSRATCPCSTKSTFPSRMRRTPSPRRSRSRYVDHAGLFSLSGLAQVPGRGWVGPSRLIDVCLQRRVTQAGGQYARRPSSEHHFRPLSARAAVTPPPHAPSSEDHPPPSPGSPTPTHSPQGAEREGNTGTADGGALSPPPLPRYISRFRGTGWFDHHFPRAHKGHFHFLRPPAHDGRPRQVRVITVCRSLCSLTHTHTRGGCLQRRRETVHWSH